MSRFSYTILNNVITAVTTGSSGSTIATIPDSVTSIESGVFELNTVITGFVCTSSSLLNQLGDRVFRLCTNLTSVTLGTTNLLSIGIGCFRNCSSLSSITIPNSVTFININCFTDCILLTSVTLPSSLPSISSSCFVGCLLLQSITIPSAVTFVGTNAFQNCSGLTSVTLNGVGTSTVLNTNSFVGTTTSINKSTIVNLLAKGYTPTQLTSAGFVPSIISRFSYTIVNNVITAPPNVSGTGTTYAVIPDSVTSTLDNIFLNNTVITEIICTGGSLLNQFGTNVFQGCTNLTNVTLSSTSLKSISASCFSGCTALPNITIPSAVTLINTNAFQNCTGLTSVTLNCVGTSTVLNTDSFIDTSSINDESVRNLLSKGYIQSQLTNAGFKVVSRFSYDISNNVIIGVTDNLYGTTIATIPDSVTSTSNSLFLDNTVITEFICTSGSLLNQFGISCFSGCSNLTNVTLNTTNLTLISTSCFSGCSLLLGVIIPISVTSIGNTCFSGCSTLSTVTIPSAVTLIDTNAFQNCTGLTSVTLNCAGTSTVLNTNSFIGTTSINQTTINNLLEKGYNPLQLTNAGFTIISRFTYDISNNVIIAVYDSGVGYTFTIIDDSVTGAADSIFRDNVFVTSFICTGSSLLNSLGSSVFQGCTNLTNVTIPNSVTSFGTACFSGCAALPNITLPNSLESIVFNCFLGCSSLTSITIPNSVSFIGTACFSGCSSLSSITFSSSVESISNNSFSGCSSLISVTIPSTITLIESYAFRNCTGLTSVTLNSAGKSTRLNTNSFLDTTSMSRTTVTNLLAKGYTQPQLTNAGFIAPPAPANPSSLSYTYY